MNTTRSIFLIAIATSILGSKAFSDPYTGTIQVTNGFCAMSCSIALDATFTPNPTAPYSLSINSASISGNPICSFTSLTNLPAIGYFPHSSLPSPLSPIDFYISTGVDSFCGGDCSGSMIYTYDFLGGIQINDDFGTTCSVTGSVVEI